MAPPSRGWKPWPASRRPSCSLDCPAGWRCCAAAGSRGLPRAAPPTVRIALRMAPPSRGWKPWPASRRPSCSLDCPPDGTAVPRPQAVACLAKGIPPSGLPYRIALPCRGWKPWAGLFPQKVAARGNLPAELVEIEIFLSLGGKSGELRERGDCQKPPLRT